VKSQSPWSSANQTNSAINQLGTLERSGLGPENQIIAVIVASPYNVQQTQRIIVQPAPSRRALHLHTVCPTPQHNLTPQICTSPTTTFPPARRTQPTCSPAEAYRTNPPVCPSDPPPPTPSQSTRYYPTTSSPDPAASYAALTVVCPFRRWRGSRRERPGDR